MRFLQILRSESNMTYKQINKYVQAARAYDAAARSLHGAMANLNFPEEESRPTTSRYRATSRYRGVCRDKGAWRAKIHHNHKYRHLGTYRGAGAEEMVRCAFSRSSGLSLT
eukprot:COSAG01_NODE_181_length_22873_cov_12.951392_3_plen_111_part_00